MNKWKSIFEKCMGNGLKKENMIVFILLGVLLFIIVYPIDENKSEKSVLLDSKSEIIKEEINTSTTSNNKETDYITYLEEKLENTLSFVEGVGKIKVMVTVSTSQKEVVEKDRAIQRSNTTETDSEGGTRNINNTESTETTLYTVDGNGNQIPYVTQVYEPEITGVMVVAQGAGKENVNSDISEAIQALFGIEAHKIKIAKMKIE
ncbi:MAG: stage III sporulation protein AG [Lachnospiraceae bacterium]|nr:stage III sporulation protein AG [Lachnospiraceae bacterium]